ARGGVLGAEAGGLTTQGADGAVALGVEVVRGVVVRRARAETAHQRVEVARGVLGRGGRGHGDRGGGGHRRGGSGGGGKKDRGRAAAGQLPLAGEGVREGGAAGLARQLVGEEREVVGPPLQFGVGEGREVGVRGVHRI